MSIQVRSITAALIILLFGIWLGRVTAVAPPPVLLPSVLENESPEEKGVPAAPSASETQADERGEPAVARLLAGLESDPRLGLARKIAEWGGDPGETLGVIIDSMSDRELRVALTSLTNFNDEQLDRIRDMRRFTRRLAEVAVDSIYAQAAPQLQSTVDVQFSSSVDARNAPESVQESFSGDGRIYAVFPMDEYREDEVFVKWYRRDDPEILLFDQYSIQRGAEFSYVWLEQKGGWAEGEYAVEFYSADEALQQIAIGEYVVDPRAASHNVE